MKRAPTIFISSLVLFLLSTHAFSAIIIVEGECTLADAIQNANFDGDGTFGKCVAGSGEDEIQLTGDVVLAAVLPSITSIITIQGNGYEIRRDSANEFGILGVAAQGDLTLIEATLSNWQCTRGRWRGYS